MKKVSTAARGELGKFAGQRLTIGLDLGDRSSWYCILDEQGELLLEQKVATTPKAMKEVFGAMPRSRIALETGMHSPWVSRLLSELGQEVIVAHARNVRLIGDSRRKDDRFCPNAGPTAEDRSAVAVPGATPQSKGASGSDGDPGAGRTSASAHGPDQYGPRADEVVWRAPARLQPAEDERRTSPGAEPGVAECLATLAGGNRIAQRAHP